MEHLLESIDKLQHSLTRQLKLTNRLASSHTVPWSWLAKTLFTILETYPSGITTPILLMELEKSWETWTRSIDSTGTEYATISSLSGNQSSPSKIHGHVNQVECKNGIWSGLIADTKRNDTISILFSESVSALLEIGVPILNMKIRIANPKLTKDHRGMRVLPSPFTVFVSQDPAFGSTYFTSAYPLVKSAVNEMDEWRFRMDVMECIETASGWDVCVRDQVSNQNAHLQIWKTQSKLMELFEVGDTIGIWRPYMDQTQDGQWRMQVGSSTLLFVLLEATPSIGAQSTLMGMIRNDRGQFDFQSYMTRLTITKMHSDSVNISLLGFVEAIIPNAPLAENGQILDRYGIQISDETGTQSITFWDSLGRECSSLQVGMLILVSGLSTFSHDGYMYVNARKSFGGSIHVVTTLTGLLTTPSLIMTTPLASAISSKQKFFCARGRIQKLRPGSNGSFTVGLHSVCKKKIRIDDEKGWICDMCLSKADHRDIFFQFHAQICSLETRLWMEIGWKMGEDLLGTSAKDFVSLSDRERQELIDKVQGMQIDLMASQMEDRVRLDAFVPHL